MIEQKVVGQKVIMIRAESGFEGAKNDFDLLKQKVILIRAKSDFEGAKGDLMEQKVILILLEQKVILICSSKK